MNASNRFVRMLTLLAVVCLTLVVGARAVAEDTVHLKDGTAVTGEIKQELDGYIWIVTTVNGIEREQILKPSQIQSIERQRDTAPASPDEPGRPDAVASSSAPAGASNAMPHSGAPRAAVISFGEGGDKDMVGVFVTADSFKHAYDLLEEENIDIVVILVKSGGGALLEIQKLSDEFENHYKKRFRTVAWIDSAISAAAMSSHALEEIYFMTRGNYGACTGWSGQLVAVKGRGLEEVLYMMEKISARGKHDPKIMRSMQILEPLSASIDENGDVTWYQNEDGEYLVNRGDRILTFNSQTAAKYGFSSGTADNLDELAHAMGLTEVEWVGKREPGELYPICKAEQYLRDFRDQVLEDQTRFNEYVMKYQTLIGMAQSSPKEDRGKFVNKARQALNIFVRMVKNNPNFALFQFNMLPSQFDEYVEQQKQLLRDLMK